MNLTAKLEAGSGWLGGAAGMMWEASLAASVLAVVVGLVCWVMGKRLGPGWRFALWGIVLVRLLVPIVPESGFSLFNLRRALERNPVVQAKEVPIVIAPEASEIPIESGVVEPIEIGGARTEAPTTDWGTIFAAVWLGGVILLGGRLLVGAIWLRWRIAREVSAVGSENLEAIWAAAAREMNVSARCRLVLTDVVSSPALFGVWEPKLLMPRGLVGSLDEAQLRHVFLHELAHLKRRDLLVNWCMAAAQVLHWWNPLVWFAMSRMRLERELACDEMVLRVTCGERGGSEEGRAYGETILLLVEAVTGGKRMAGLVGIAEEKNAIRKRVEQIASFGERGKTGRYLGGVIVVLLAAGGLTNAHVEKAARNNFEDGTQRAAEAQTSVATLLQEARTLIERKKWEEAELKLKETIKIAPQHPEEVLELLSSVRQRRYSEEANVNERGNTGPAGVNKLAQNERKQSGSGRQAIVKKLNEIVIDRYEVPNALPLTEIIKDIYATARKLDPEKKGVNFIISSQLENPGVVEGDSVAALTDLGTGKGPLKLGDYRVTISPALRDVTLLGLVEAIVQVAVPPGGHEGAPGLRYAVEDYAVVFGQRVKEAEALYTRTYKVDPNTFIQGLNLNFTNGLPRDEAGRSAAMQQGVRQFFNAAGINLGGTNLSPGTPPQSQKAVFLNDRTGVLFVRATLRDLNLVETALQAMQVQTVDQMVFRMDAVEVKDKGELERLIAAMSLPEFRTTLTSLEYRAFRAKREIAEMPWMQMPSITTLSGRQARAEVEESVGVDVVADYNKKEKTLKVQASSYSGSREKLSTRKEGEIYDGQTFVLIPDAKGQTVTPGRVVFITVDVIDAAGNKVNVDDAFLERTRDRVP